MQEGLHDIQNPSWEPEVGGGKKQTQRETEKNERGKNTTPKFFIFFFEIKLIWSRSYNVSLLNCPGSQSLD